MVKIALTYIVKDNSEAKKFEKSLKSFTPYFDGLFVVVNGLSGQHDEIHKLVKRYKGTSISTNLKTHPQLYKQRKDGSYFFASFKDARNVSFDMVPKEFDYMAWADTDDILVGGEQLRKIAENAKERNVDLVNFTYAYKNVFDHFGNLVKVVTPHQRERLIANNGKFKWYSRLHEVILTKDEGQKYSMDKHVYKKDNIEVAWVHTANDDDTKNGGLRNLEILNAQAEEEEYKDPRTLFYLGKSHFDIRDVENLNKSYEWFEKYIEISGWDAEIAQAYEYMGLVKTSLGDLEGALENYKKCIDKNPLSHGGYLKLADIYLAKDNYEFAKHYLRIYEAMPPVESDSLVVSPVEIETLYYTVQFQTALKEKRMKDAIKYAEKRHELVKDTVLDELKVMDEVETIAQAFFNVAVFYVRTKQFDLLWQIVNSVPKSLEKENIMKRICSSFPPKKWNDKTIVYYASFYDPHFEEWNGGNLHTGIGGSESAVIYLSEQWVKMGYDVVVFCDTPIDIEINGVKYVKYWKVNWNDHFDTIIFWRSPGMLDFPVKSNKIFLDLHDVAYKQDYTQYRMDKVDKVFFKSRAHREQVPQLPDDKAVVISNGITL